MHKYSLAAEIRDNWTAISQTKYITVLLFFFFIAHTPFKIPQNIYKIYQKKSDILWHLWDWQPDARFLLFCCHRYVLLMTSSSDARKQYKCVGMQSLHLLLWVFSASLLYWAEMLRQQRQTHLDLKTSIMGCRSEH